MESSPSSTPPTPPPDFRCETQRAYAFSLHCKRSFHPTLTHQFEVEWPWPTLRPTTTAATAAALHPVKHEGEEETEETSDMLPTPAFSSTAAGAGDVSTPLWRDRRRYGRPTYILDLSSDPFLAGLETRRAGLLLSPGYRLLLPLTALETAEELPDGAGRAFWKPLYRPPHPSAAPATTSAAASSSSPSSALPATAAAAASPPPYCAELLFGEVTSLERTVRRRHEAAGTTAAVRRSAAAYPKPAFLSKISLLPQRARAAATEESADAEGGPLASASPPPPQQQKQQTLLRAFSTASSVREVPKAAVLSYFLYTIPFRVRWLSQMEGRVVVSLPCEERVITLHVPHTVTAAAAADRKEGGGFVSETLPVAITQVHSFAFPRGVVPLEVAEVFERPFLAIGTSEHGVLICGLDAMTGAVDSVVRVVSLRGNGSSVFPVTRLATLFPPRRDAAQNSSSSSKRDTQTSSLPGRAVPAWAHRAAALESLRDGALLCSSPYEPSATLVKLDGPPEGVVEDFPGLRGVDTVLDVGPTIQPDLGPVLCTATRKVQWLHFLSSEDTEAKLNAVTSRRSDHGLAERTSPAVWCDRMIRLDYPLLRLMASPPVLQAFASNYVSKHGYTKHWRFGVDNRNSVVLLDRTVSQYVFQSSFQLYRVSACSSGSSGGDGLCAGAPAGSVLTSTTASAGLDSVTLAEKRLVQVKKEEEEEEAKGERAEGVDSTTEDAKAPKRARASATAGIKRTAKQPKLETVKQEDGEGGANGINIVHASHALVASVVLEDACSGVVVTMARDELIQVAAAHDGRCVSLVTWRIGPPPPPPPPASFFCPVLKEEKK